MKYYDSEIRTGSKVSNRFNVYFQLRLLGTSSRHQIKPADGNVLIQKVLDRKVSALLLSKFLDAFS